MIGSLLLSTASAAASTSAAPTASATATAAPPAPTKVPSGPFPGPFPPVDEKICKTEEYKALKEKASKVLPEDHPDDRLDTPRLIKAIGELKPDLCKTDCGKHLAKIVKKSYTPKNETAISKELKDAFTQLDCNNAYMTKASLALLLLAVV